MAEFLYNNNNNTIINNYEYKKFFQNDSINSTSATPNIVTTYVGIRSEIGKGTYKTVYSCIETDNVNNKIFTLPYGVNIDRLVIVVIDIIKILTNLFKTATATAAAAAAAAAASASASLEASLAAAAAARTQRLFEMYINEPEKLSPKRQVDFKSLIDNQIKTIHKEIKLQNLFFEKQLAPKIYEHRFDEDKKMFYILEKKCGSPLLTYITKETNQTEDNFNKIVELVTKIADTGYINVDIKPENTCTKFENGLLSEIIALDFDTDFFIKIDLTNEEIKEQGKIFMLTLFIAYLRKYYPKIVFEKVIVEKHLNCSKIKDMLTFFARNTEICAKEMHPIFMLYYYIIKNPKNGTCYYQTHNIIQDLTTRICSYIFPTKGGSRKFRRPRSKKSKKSRK